MYAVLGMQCNCDCFGIGEINHVDFIYGSKLAKSNYFPKIFMVVILSHKTLIVVIFKMLIANNVD